MRAERKKSLTLGRLSIHLLNMKGGDAPMAKKKVAPKKKGKKK